MSWKLGQFIEQVLHEKGGKRAGWHQSKLAELSGLSTGHVSWIVTGESSGKKGPPEIGIETLIALAKGLGIKEQALVDAYKGNNPDTTAESVSSQFAQEILNVLLKNISPEVFAEALLALDGPEKIKQHIQEAKLREKEP